MRRTNVDVLSKPIRLLPIAATVLSDTKIPAVLTAFRPTGFDASGLHVNRKEHGGIKSRRFPDNAIALLELPTKWTRPVLPRSPTVAASIVYVRSFMSCMSTVRGFGHVLASLFLSIFPPEGAAVDLAPG